VRYRIRAAISNAYYTARNAGLSMEVAADSARNGAIDVVLGLIHDGLSAEETQPDAEPPACQVIVSASGLARCETHGVAVITAEDFRIHGALSAEEPQPTEKGQDLQ
jgi:hypothetical protein